MNITVFKGKTVDGVPYLIRYPKRSDLHEIWRYINELSQEKSFISFQGEVITLKEERIFLNGSIRLTKLGQGLLLVVESKGKIVGVSDIRVKPRVSSHIGVFGISLAKEFRGKGVGKNLMQTLMLEAPKVIKNLKILELECFSNNAAALELYKSLGFKEYGRLPGGIAYRGKFIDAIFMYYPFH